LVHSASLPFYQKLAPFPKGVHSASLPFFAEGEEGEEGEEARAG
jgi:hypothetical protein